MMEEEGELSSVGKSFVKAIGQMPAKDKYNAVLQSLLSSEGGSSEAVLDLVKEMTTSRISMNSEGVKKMVDASVSDDNTILRTLGAVKANGACKNYGTSQFSLPSKPSASELESLPATPSDARGLEVSAASVVLGLLGFILFGQVLDILPGVDIPTGPLFFLTLAVFGYDRYSTEGQLLGVVSRGSNRLLSRDLQRECNIESASFIVGYLLGLPCCPFAPNVDKPLEMLAASGTEITAAFERSSEARLVDRVLIWLLAPAAAENSAYNGEMLLSDAAVAKRFLEAARRREGTTGVDVQDGIWKLEEDDKRIDWAYSESKKLLDRYSSQRQALQDRMAAGVSAGDCVVLVEEALGGLS